MNTMIVKTLSAGFFMAGLFFVFAFISGALFCSFGSKRPLLFEHMCLPLSRISDVAVAPDGFVHVALAFYGRVQIYDRRGKFVRGMFVESGGGTFFLNFDRDGQLEIIATKGSKKLTLDSSGAILKSENLADLKWRQFAQRADNGWQTPDGDHYHIVNPFFAPQVVRESAGIEFGLIETPWELAMFVAPAPVWLAAFSCMTLSYISRAPFVYEGICKIISADP